MADRAVRPMPEGLARAHAWARAQPWLARFTLMNRVLLAMAFFPTGLVKATGQPLAGGPVPTHEAGAVRRRHRPIWSLICSRARCERGGE